DATVTGVQTCALPICRYVILPAVPGTGHQIPVHNALAQRPAPVQARIADRIILSADVGQGNCLALDLEFPNGPRGDLVRLGSSRKRHLFFSLLIPSVRFSAASVLNPSAS